jgi:protein TonB
VNVDGTKDDGLVAPAGPVGDGGKGILEAPKKEDDGPVFVPIEAEAQFPGGMQAWARFLNKNLRFPDDAQNNGIDGQVVVQFVVDRDGSISDVEAVSGPTSGGLREEAIRVIRKSGKWLPGNQNGRLVKSYKRQPVTFQLTQ